MTLGASLAMIAAAVISYLGIDLFRRYSLTRNWVDIPNERSSHIAPTPRGGGLVIALICFVAYLAISLFAPNVFSWGYYLGAVLIVMVSWLDDLFSISFGWRLLVHLAAAVLVVIASGYWQVIEVPAAGTVSLGPAGAIVTIVWIVWIVNAYNFMDGIDGIAGLQAVVAAAAWTMIAAQSGTIGTFLFMLILAGSCFGFLVHNWSPARIFMGDVGSAFLGFTFATVPLILVNESGMAAPRLPTVAIFILWPFLFDTILTVLRRTVKRERLWLAHRDHLYQKLVIAGYKHGFVSLVYGLFAAISSSIGIVVFGRNDDVAFYLSLVVLFLTLIFIALVFWLTGSPNREEIA
jgi:Fuc2NAc and GlcNAc transferase